MSAQRELIYPRRALQHLALPSAPPEVERLRLRLNSDGEQTEEVEAWFLPALPESSPAPASAPRPLVVFAHGNGELIDQWWQPLSEYRRRGYHVLLPEYRGYGRSAGNPSQDAIVDDVFAFVQQAQARSDVNPSKTVFHGRSLGGGVLVAVARRMDEAQSPAAAPLSAPAALVLESTFTSLEDVVGDMWLPKSLLLDTYRTLPWLRRYRRPVLVIHGTSDRVVGFGHAVKLAAEAPHARLVPVDAGHNDVPHDASYWRRLDEFLAEALSDADGPG